MITLYGTPASRTFRCLWMLQELGLEYEHIPTNFVGENKQPDYLALNPNGRIPTLVDGDTVLWESMAINLYLAKKYGGALWPEAEADRAQAVQWSFWGITEIEPHLMAILIHRIMLPEDKRQPELADAGERDIARPLKVLEAHLDGRNHLLGGDFTIADLNVASVLAMAAMVGLDLSAWPRVEAWLASATGRPSMEKARAAGA
jgi:glutathione S-transferase